MNVPKFATLTVTLPCVVTLLRLIVHVVPEPDSNPFDTAPVPLVIVMSLAVSPVTDWLNMRVIPVELAVPLVPPVCVAVNVTDAAVRISVPCDAGLAL